MQRAIIGSASALWASAAVALTITGGAAEAQQAASQVAADSSAKIPEVLITGSRISRTALDTTTPVVSVTSADIAAEGLTNVGDVLNRLPQAGIAFITGTNSNFQNDSAGLEIIDLRNLGSARTLVLIDGRRVVGGSPGLPSVDVATIPAFMIDRVDVVTGGGSSAYGSEAIAGAVNIILKKRVDGYEANQQFGVSQYGDNFTSTTDLLGGAEFGGGRGHFVGSFSYLDQASIQAKDRSFSKNDLFGGGSLGEPVYHPSSYSAGGTFGTDNAGVVALNKDGSISPYDSSHGYNRNQDRLLDAPLSRLSVYTKTSYEFTDDISGFVDTRFARSYSTAQLEPIALDGSTTVGPQFPNPNYLTLPLSNPLIPAALLAASPTDDGLGNFADFRRRIVEAGLRGGDTERFNYGISLGLNGTIANRFDWTFYYTYGRTESHTDNSALNMLHFQQGLNVVNSPSGPVCQDPAAVAAGCVPVNIFGAGSITPAALRWIEAKTTFDDELDQNVVSGNIGGPILELPYGDLKFNVGAEYRRESTEQIPDLLTQQGYSSNNQIPPLSGNYDVREIYAETLIPVLKDLPFVKSFSIEFSDRYGDYSTVGATNSTKYGASWAPVEDIVFRGANAVAIRAPNITELYSAPGQSFLSVTDPCSDVGISGASNPALRVANCSKIAGITPGFTENPAQQQGEVSIQSGNAALQAERARVLTFGTALTPRFIPGFAMTVDYYSFIIQNAVTTLPLQTAANQCVDTGAPIYCNLVHRDPHTGLIRGVDSRYVNVGANHARGIDVGVDYSFKLEELGMLLGFGANPDEKIDLSWNYSFLANLDTSAAGATTYQAGLYGAPKNKWNFSLGYQNNDLKLYYSMRYVGSESFDSGNGGPVYGAYTYSDISARYRLTDNIVPYIGIRNLFNQKPPLAVSPYDSGGNGYDAPTAGTNTLPEVYDVIGRSVFAGLNVKF